MELQRCYFTISIVLKLLGKLINYIFIIFTDLIIKVVGAFVENLKTK